MGYVSNLDNVLADLAKAALMGLDETAEDIANVAEGLVNVDQGDLKRSIKALPAERNGNEVHVEVGSFGVAHAVNQEFGKHGKPYLRPALKAKGSAEQIASNIRKHL